MRIVDETVVRRLLKKYQDQLAEKSKANEAKIGSLFKLEADHVQNDGRLKSEIDDLTGRVAAFDEFVAEKAMTEGQKIDDLGYKAFKTKLDETTAKRSAAQSAFERDGRKLQTEINENDLPEQRRIAGKVKQCEDILQELLSPTVDEHPTLLEPRVTSEGAAPIPAEEKKV